MAGTECVVCLENFDQAEHFPCVFSCGHPICLACAAPQLKQGFCPSCRGKVTNYTKVYFDFGAASGTTPPPQAPPPKPKNQLKIGRVPKAGMLQFKQTFLAKLETLREGMVTSVNFVIANLEPHATSRFMTCILNLRDDSAKEAVKKDLQSAIFRFKSSYYGLMDINEAVGQESLARANYDIILVAEGMPAEPEVLVIEHIQPWNDHNAEKYAQFVNQYYGSKFGVQGTAISTKKPGERFPSGQVFLEVASESAKDELLQELLVKGVRILWPMWEPVQQSPTDERSYVAVSHLERQRGQR